MTEAGIKAKTNPSPQSFTSFVQPRKTVQVLHLNYPRTHHLWHTTEQSNSPALYVLLPKREVFRNYPSCFLRAATPNRLSASISLDSFHKPFIRSARTRACNDASQFFILNIPMNYGQACRGLHYFPTALPFVSATSSLAVLRQHLPLPDLRKHSSALIDTGGNLHDPRGFSVSPYP